MRWLRDECSDEIPEKIIHSHKDNRERPHKVRKNWFTGFVGDLDNLLNHNEISDPELKKLAEQAIKKFTSDEFKKQPLTTPEDIEYANSVISMILGN